MTTTQPTNSTMSQAVAAIQAQLAINKENLGREFYRHEYDLALHIYCALHTAGLKVVRQRSK